MPRTGDSLADLVRARRSELELSLRQVADRTGGAVSYSTVHAIETGSYRRHGIEVLQALARALSLPEARVLRAAGREPRPRPFVLPEQAAELTAAERRVIVGMVNALLEARRR